jgi:hypothetical protein
LLDRLQNGSHKGKGGLADQSMHGRTGLEIRVIMQRNLKGEERNQELWKQKIMFFWMRKNVYSWTN